MNSFRNRKGKKEKKEPNVGFTSFRIIGEKAQRLLARAKELQQAPPPKETTPLPMAEKLPERVMHLSLRSIVQATFAVLAIIGGTMLVYFLKDKIVIFALAIFIATVLDPGVQWLKRMGVPRGLGILLHYFVALFLVIFLLISFIPLIAEQLQQIAVFVSDEANAFLANPSISLPFLTQEVNARLTLFVQTTLQDLSIVHFADALRQAGQNMSDTAQGSIFFLAALAGSVVEFVVNMVLILVLAFFIQLEKEKIISWIRGFLPLAYRSYMDDKSEAIQWKLAQWVRGQLLLCLCIGLLVFLALTVLGMPYALTLGLLAGFTEFIPVVGPVIAAVPAVLIALTQEGMLWALVVAAVYYVIQWCENNLLVPLIMKRAVGLSPIAIIFAMLVGVSFPLIIHPVLGIILSIPCTTILALFLEDWRNQRTRLANREKRANVTE